MGGDPHQFGELLREHRSRVFGYLYSLVHNFADAEDLYQQTAVVLWKKFDEFVPGSDFGAWATTTAHYVALGFLRKQSRRRVLLSEAALERLSASQQAIPSQEFVARTEALAKCVEQLTADERRLLKSRYQSDEALTELAKSQSRTVGSLYTALSRIRRSLLRCVELRIRREASA